MESAEGPQVEGPLVAVLGGGQLGLMLGSAGIPLGIRFRFLDPSADAPARAVGPLLVSEFSDDDALVEIAAEATVVTYEWEGVPAEAARRCETTAPVRPNPRALEVAQDRVVEKDMFRRLGIDAPASAPVLTRADLDVALNVIGLPAVLKTRRGGYDGKGQRVVRDPDEVDAAWRNMGRLPLIVEAHVPFTRELSVLAARGLDGATAFYPLVENQHGEGILHVSRAPAPGLTPELQAAGEEIATRLLDELDYVGVLAVELFECDGQLLANELAPRVHNSGHWTIEGAETSQFENHLRAVLGWPLGSTAAHGYSAMVNCIGVMPSPERLLAIDDAHTHIHDYGKQARAGRKVGHVTVLADTEDDLTDRLEQVLAAISAEDGD